VPFLRPDADLNDGTWINASGNNTSLYDSLDETVASDADFIRSVSDPANDIVTVRLSNPSGTPQQPGTVRVRYKKAGTAIMGLAVRLIQGTGVGTVIAEWFYDDITDSYVDAAEQLTSAQFTAITDFNDLYLQFEATVGNVSPFLLDVYPNAAFAFSFRKLRNAYAGSAVRIRRSSDNAEADIGFDGEGDFDTAAAASHIGGGSGFIVTWYDQSGNGRDVTQATAADQPTYTASGISGLPVASFDGANEYLITSANFALFPLTEGTVFSAMQQNGGTAAGMLFHWQESSSTTRINAFVTFSDNNLYLDFGLQTGGRVNVAQPSGWDDTPHVLELYRDSSDNQAIVVDGIELVSDVLTADTVNNAGTLYIGQRNDGNIHFGGLVAELVLWQTDLASERANARANINNYYLVYQTLLLDLYPTALLGYSFRKLRRNYTGAAVRLRRSSDNAEFDIGFDGDDFDTAGAASFLSGSNGFIVTWYDQSGNGYNMTQATAGSQPAYAASGIGGKACADFTKASSQCLATGVDAVPLGANIDMTTVAVFVCDNTGGDPANIANAVGDGQANSTGNNQSVAMLWRSSGDSIGQIVGAASRGSTTNPDVAAVWGAVARSPHAATNFWLYLDGAEVATGEASSWLGLPGSQDATFGIGADAIAAVGYLDGQFSEMIVWEQDHHGSGDIVTISAEVAAYYGV
jgi:Alpha-L-arabinofuranosidase B, catalytic